jgi:hypothetical protein
VSTAETILADLESRGLRLVADGDDLIVRPRNQLTGAYRRAIRLNKAGLLALLTGERPAVLAEMERVLMELRQQLAPVERDHYGGRFPEHVGNLVADGLAICEGHIRGCAKLAAQGWDPLKYLRGQARLTLALARGERQGPPEPPT